MPWGERGVVIERLRRKSSVACCYFGGVDVVFARDRFKLMMRVSCVCVSM